MTPFQLAGGDWRQVCKECLKWVAWGYEKLQEGDTDSLNQMFACFFIEHTTEDWAATGFVPMTHIEWPQDIEE